MGNPSPKPRQLDRAEILGGAASMGSLDASPGAGPQMLAMLCNPNVAASKVVALIERQPGICARMLRVANSAYYGQSRVVTTIERAVLLLGLDAVRGIGAAACLDRGFPLRGTPLLIMGAVINHSLATAIAAEQLAKLLPGVSPADAFIAGLLHNLGTAVQMRIDSNGVDSIIAARRFNSTRTLRELEFEYSAVTHEMCAETVFTAWQLPAGLVASAANHHAPLDAPPVHRSLACLVSLGAHVALRCGYCFELETCASTVDFATLQAVDLTQEQLDSVAEQLPTQFVGLRGALFE